MLELYQKVNDVPNVYCITYDGMLWQNDARISRQTSFIRNIKQNKRNKKRKKKRNKKILMYSCSLLDMLFSLFNNQLLELIRNKNKDNVEWQDIKG